MSGHFGPWTVSPLEGKYYGTEVYVGSGTYVTVWGDRAWKLSPREMKRSGPFVDGWTESECMSDGHYEDLNDYKKACLIAAAPELLEALRDIHQLACDAIENMTDEEKFRLDYANRIIEKALGK